jgi:predicted amidohydrolase
MKIAVAQTKPIKADIAANTISHSKLIDIAVMNGAQMIVFPELSLSGYEPELAKELAMTPTDRRLQVFQKLSDAHQVSIGLGLPTPTAKGISISMLLFQPGKETGIYSKKYLHTDEDAFFVSADSTPTVILNDKKIALAICYELLLPAHAQTAADLGSDIYIASAVKSVGSIAKSLVRLAEIARKYSMTVFFSNCIGDTGGYDCAGKSSIWDNHGNLLAQLDDTHEGILMLDTETGEILEKMMEDKRTVERERD